MKHKKISFQVPCAGVPTFLRSELIRDRTEVNSDFSFVGIPYDLGSSNRIGSCYGPRAFREVSMLYAYFLEGKKFDGFYDSEMGLEILKGATFADTDDIIIVPRNQKRSEEIITGELKKIIGVGSFPICVGGDHSISYPIIKAYEIPISVIQFDSHGDFMTLSYEETCLHGCVMRKVSLLDHVNEIIHCGIRGLLSSKEGLEDSVAKGNKVITSSDLYEKGISALEEVLQANRIYYITFDADFLDPTIAPGTGTPEPGGLNYNQAKSLIKFVGSNYDVIGIDIVELNPLFDPTTNTAQHLVRLLIDFLGVVHKRRK